MSSAVLAIAYIFKNIYMFGKKYHKHDLLSLQGIKVVTFDETKYEDNQYKKIRNCEIFTKYFLAE
jgi:hypothetical protein